MRLFDLIKLATSNLKRRKMRTVLTVLGVAIGTASIVVMVSLGIGMSAMMLKSYQSMGSLTRIDVYEGGYGGGTNGDQSMMLTDETVESLKHIPHVTGVSPSIEVYIEAKCKGISGSFSIVGVTQDYLRQLELRDGGHLPAANSDTLELLYGNQILYSSFYKQKTWENVEIDPEKDTVFITFPQSSVSQGGAEDWSDGSYNVYTDIDSLKRFLKKIYKKALVPNPRTNKNGKPYPYYVYNNVYVFVDDMDNVSVVQKQISDMGFSVSSSMEWLKQAQQQLNMVQLVLGGIGGVSLLVAAIGIMNTMMMSIYERTKEIGVMKVLGCAMPDFRNMFLCESGMIGLMGGLAGLAVSYLISYIINFFTKNAGSMMFGSGSMGGLSSIPLWLAAFAIGFAIAVGTIAGYVPAARAMKLSPLAAIRNE